MNRAWLVALAAAAAACAPQERAAQAPSQADVVARGQYLVLHVAGCNDCHTPMTPSGPDMARHLAGAELGFAPRAPQPWAPYAPPLAGLPAGYDEGQLAQFLQTGARPTLATPALPPMPAYRMNAEDAAAVAAYIASLPKPAAP